MAGFLQSRSFRGSVSATGAAGAVGRAIEGDKALDAALARLAGPGARRVNAGMMNASLAVLAKALRAAVNASDASSELKRAARQAIGRKRRKDVAKVGFGVGKKRAASPDKRTGKSGVGISANNIHWPVLGTGERQTKAGRKAGKMPAIFAGATDQALATGGPAALAAARAKCRELIAREAARTS